MNLDSWPPFQFALGGSGLSEKLMQISQIRVVRGGLVCARRPTILEIRGCPKPIWSTPGMVLQDMYRDVLKHGSLGMLGISLDGGA